MFRPVPVRIHWSLLAFFGLILLSSMTMAVTEPGMVVIQLALFGGLFGTILIHEFAHVIVARRFGAQVIEILLTPLGGLTRMRRMPERPVEEALVAFAGPAINLLIAVGIMLWAGYTPVVSQLGAVFGLRQAGQPGIDPHSMADVIVIIGSINLLLGGANLFIPAFPMDGGRILRAWLATRMNFLRATMLAVAIGRAIGLAFLITGLYLLISSEDNGFVGVVLIIIAIYLQLMASAEVQQAAARTVFQRYSARYAVQPDAPFGGPSMTVAEAQQLMAARQVRGIPVVNEHDYMVGWAALPQVMAASMQSSPQTPLANVMTRYPWVKPDDRLWTVVREMQAWQVNPLPVVEPDGRYIGLITLERLTAILQADAPALLQQNP